MNVMNITETYRITDLLRRAFDGTNAWHGPSIIETISGLKLEETINQVADSHNVAELIEHMIAWRTFAIKKLQGEEAYDVLEDINFLKITAMTQEMWQDMMQRLYQTQDDFLRILSQTQDEKLAETVSGRDYNFYTLLHGIIQHDLYHLGQIVLLRKL